jgi:hypothetical protein
MGVLRKGVKRKEGKHQRPKPLCTRSIPNLQLNVFFINSPEMKSKERAKEHTSVLKRK